MMCIGLLCTSGIKTDHHLAPVRNGLLHISKKYVIYFKIGKIPHNVFHWRLAKFLNQHRIVSYK